MKQKRKIRSKGKGLLKEEWYSICSVHFEYDENCSACNAGTWINVYKNKISSFIFDIFPKIWIWYQNRPNSKARKQIEEWFPKLKSK